MRILMWVAGGILVLFVLAGMGGGGVSMAELTIANLCLIVLVVGAVYLLARRRP